MESAELARLDESREWDAPWKKWGPYLSERQWGTVREDYSENGDAWNYFPHDQARSRAYHWGEDGLAGFCDLKQRLCFAIALWNGNDPILKERLFGLSNGEGNHGEDVKEYYFYLDSTPTHSYMKWLYKYPQAAFPYGDLIATNVGRSRQDYEYELIDTGVFNDDRYFDVVVEYAKSSPEECFVQITVTNRGPETAAIHVLPTLWFRNTWSWWPGPEKPILTAAKAPRGTSLVAASHPELGPRWLYLRRGAAAAVHRERNQRRAPVRGAQRDRIRERRVPCLRGERRHQRRQPGAGRHQGRGELPSRGRRRPVGVGAAVPHRYAGRERHLRRSTRRSPPGARRRTSSIAPARPSPRARIRPQIMRQAFAGLFWTKQYYFFDVNMWLREHGVNPFDSPSSSPVRNRQWFHMFNDDVISMPDKWEYPWYAAWDLAFHAVAMARVDPDLAKHQLTLMLKPRYQHSNGQLPAYEWNFGDVNPPVHAWATLFQYRIEQAMRGHGDVEFLKRAFGKLLINFTWWVNRKDRLGKSVFEGGFLGLDNIGIFDRSADLPTGGHLEQADGTAWMAMFCQNMFEIAVELAEHDPTYDDLVFKFAEHFLWIGVALNKVGHDGMWDEEDGFYYDVLRLPDGGAARLKVRSLVGLLPLCATTVIERAQRERVPGVVKSLQARFGHIPELLWRRPPDGTRAYERQRPHHFGAGRCRSVAADPVTAARRAGVLEPARHPLAVEVSRAESLRPGGGRAGVPDRVSAGRVRYRACSAATRTGAVRYGCR